MYEDQQISDPNFAYPPNIMYNGTTDPFGYAHVPNDHVNLSWTHEAGTLLSLTSESAPDDYPECNDFVYINKSFTWSYEEHPDGMKLILNYSLDGAGFSGLSIDQFYSVGVWFIPSSREWIRIHPSDDTFTLEEDGSDHVYFHYPLRSRMIPHFNENAKVSICIGLVPTRRLFVLEQAGEPYYTLYDGSVNLTIRDFRFVTVLDKFIEDAEAPSYWGTLTRSCSGLGIEITPDGTVVIGGGLSGYTADKKNLFISKWESDLESYTLRELETPFSDSGVAMQLAQDGSVYVIGRRQHSENSTETVLAKWGPLGSHAWTNIQNLSLICSPRDVCITPDGSVLGLVACRDSPTSTWYYQILKWTYGGNFLWSKSFYVNSHWIEAADDGSFITMSMYGNLIHWDIGGTQLSDVELNPISTEEFFFDRSEFVYTWGWSEVDEDRASVSKWRLDGTLVWTYSMWKWWYIQLDVNHDGIDVAENGTVFVSGRVGSSGAPFLIKISEGGLFLSNRTWRLTENYWSSVLGSSLAVSADSLVYTIGRKDFDHSKIDILAFGAGPGPDDWVYHPPEPSTTTTDSSTTTPVTGPTTSPTTTPITTPTPSPPGEWPVSMSILITSGIIVAITVVIIGLKSRRGA